LSINSMLAATDVSSSISSTRIGKLRQKLTDPNQTSATNR
jgi:hypothetical protein